MRIKENIIVSMTTWNKRINNVKPVFETILKQTVLPDRVVLSVCIEDFPRLTKDFPRDLVEFLDEHKDIIEVYWFLENYKAWKKHLHVLDIATDNDLIISIDDDHLYNEDFIESLYVSYVFYGKKYPVTNNKIQLCHNMWCFNGPGTLYRKRDLGDYQKYLSYNVLHNVWEDTLLGLLLVANNVMLLPNIFKLPDDDSLLFNAVSCYTDITLKPSNFFENYEQQCDEYANRVDMSLRSIRETIEKNYYNEHEFTTAASPCVWDLVLSKTAEIKQDLTNSGNHIFLPQQYVFDTNNIVAGDELSGALPITESTLNSLNCNNIRLYHKSDLIGENNRVIITIASWNKRIQNVATVLENVLYNTMPPDIIVVNLARPDFGIPPGKTPTMSELCAILPDNLFDLLIRYPEIRIHWYDDSTIKSWKKHLYVMNEFNDNDVIICIDDDKIYSQVFIETMLKSYNLYDRKFPVTYCTENYLYGTFPFHGSCMLYTPGFLRGCNRYMSTAGIHKFPEDNWMGSMLIILGHLILPVIGKNYIILDENFNQICSNFGNNTFDERWREQYNDLRKELDSIIERETKYRPEHINGWTPKIFNFSCDSTKKFLEDYKDCDKKYPFNLVYDSIKTHIESGEFGMVSYNTELCEAINWYIL